MSEWTLEKAREIVDAGNPISPKDDIRFAAKQFTIERAKGFIEGHSVGHASRDPEVADLKAEVRRLREALQHEVHCVECGESGCPCDDGCTSEEVLKSATPGHSPEGKTL